MPAKRLIPRTIRISAHLTQDEYASLMEKFKSTTCRKFSEYARDRLIGMPAIIKYRSQSVDDFLDVAIALKNELGIIHQNLDQALQRLSLLNNRNDLMASMQAIELVIFSLQQHSVEIRTRLNEIYQSCLPK